MTAFRLSCVALMSVLLLTNSAHGQEVLPYRAVYTAKAAGLSATSRRSLQHLENNQYRLSQTMNVTILGATLGKIEEISEFSFVELELLPSNYSYTQSGVSRKKESVVFDWANGTAVSSEDDDSWNLTLAPGTTDKLSLQFALRQQLLQNGLNNVSISLVDSDEIETHHYRVIGSEILTTELGELDTLKVERVRSADSGRQTIFWLAKDWDLLLVRFKQTSGSGEETELLLESATVNGKQVSPLP